MNFQNLKKFARFTVPGAKTNRVSVTVLGLALNEATKQIASDLILLPTDKKFNVVADQYQYNLTTVLDRFLVIDKGGLWWNQGSASTPQWKEIFPNTRKSLDKIKRNWRDLDAGNPQWYSQNGDILEIVPMPDTSLAEGFWLDYGQAPPIMASNSDFPFGGTTEIHRLSTLTKAILLFTESYLARSLGDQNRQIAALQEYNIEKEIQKGLLARRPDISNHRKSKWMGRRFPG